MSFLPPPWQKLEKQERIRIEKKRWKVGNISTETKQIKSWSRIVNLRPKSTKLGLGGKLYSFGSTKYGLGFVDNWLKPRFLNYSTEVARGLAYWTGLEM